MRRKSSGIRFTQHYQSNWLLKEKLDGIESSLDKISGQLKESGKRNFRSLGAGIGFAGLGTALGLSITSPTWSSAELHPSQFSFIIMALSLAIIYWCFLGFGRHYSKKMAILGTLFIIVGSLLFTISDIWLNNFGINLVSILLFLAGLCIFPISMIRKDKKEVVRE